MIISELNDYVNIENFPKLDEIEKIQRVRLKFSTDLTYCTEVAEQVRQFIHNCETDTTILGIGIAIPGIIDQKEKMVIKSHALQVENYSLRFLEQALDAPVYFENDANSAMLAEDTQRYQNAIYLSLNHTPWTESEGRRVRTYDYCTWWT